MTTVTTVYLTCSEFCEATHISLEHISELVTYTIVQPISGKEPTEWQFNTQSITTASRAMRLYQDLSLDWADVGLVINLLDEIDCLKTENQLLKQRLDRFLAQDS